MSSTVTSGTATQPPISSRVDSLVPVQTRSERFASDNPADFGAVTGREPEWKLTPVSALRPLLDGPLDGSRYNLAFDVQPGVTVEWVPAASTKRAKAGLSEDKAAANAWSLTEDVLAISIERDLTEPFVLSRDSLGSVPRAAHTVISVAQNVHATLIFESRGDALLAENVELILEQDATLQAVFTSEWDSTAIQWANHFAVLGKNASLSHIVVSLGGHVIATNPSVRLAGEGAHVDALGAYFADHSQHIEHRVYVHHEGPKTTSMVTYKGALHGKGARTVWIGDVLIGEHAVGTDSYEQNRNLVLSEGTRADSIPNLEIKTGDIEGAGHASATGRFDDEQLFYLQSRGIEEVDARRLVVMGFLGDVVSKISHPALVERLTHSIQNKLQATEGN